MKIAIVGYGRMGRAIEKAALAQGHEIVVAIDSENDWQTYSGKLAKADVAVEFTTPETAAENISRCLRLKVAVVTGTTAWEDRLPEIKKQCLDQNGTLFIASNFSIGVNIFFRLNNWLASVMDKFNQYDPSIEETHHTGKLDKPSGTAKQLADGLVAELRRKKGWDSGESKKKDHLPVISHRLEDVPGTHVVRYESAEDILEIKHTAHSREGFARGAVMAAEWLQGKKGVFSMDDLLSEMI